LPELLHHMDGRRRDPERPQETGIAALGVIREKGNMLKLNVFIDGTWLVVQCSAGGSMANATDTADRRLPLDFARLNVALVVMS
jgi:hypothetical protein